MTNRSASFRVTSLTLTLILFGCSGGEGISGTSPEVPAMPPVEPLAGDVPQRPKSCDADGHCRATLAGIEDARAICDGATPMLYWNQGRDSHLLACECNCTSHDNTGWVLHGSSGQVQGVALGKAAVAEDLINVDTVSDIMASHPFCEAADHRALQSAEFVSLIKYPTGRDDTPYCFSVRAFSISRDGLVIEDDGRKVLEDDGEIFLDTPTDIEEKVRTIVRQAAAD